MKAFEEASGEWEARTGECRPLALIPPGKGLARDTTAVHAVTEYLLQGASDRLKQLKRDKLDRLIPWHWLSPRKDWILLKTLVDKLNIPKYGWTSVGNYWCPHYKMGTQCTICTHIALIPPANYRNKARTLLKSLAEVFKWRTDFSTEDTDIEDSTGLEFNNPTLTRLYQLKRLGRTNTVVLHRTLLKKQDLIRMGADDFLEEGYHTTRGGWWIRARAEECTRQCIQCRRALSAMQVDNHS